MQAARLIRRIRYGHPVIVVSGLPRSGTSMMMAMLERGGMAIVTDRVRTADVDNPKGYFELERVKELESATDKSWLREARGKVVKVISHLLTALPADNFYRVILVQRDLDEVLASQAKMLERRGEDNPIADDEAREYFAAHLLRVRSQLRVRPNFDFLEVEYRHALDDPRGAAAEVSEFVGRELDVEAMASAVDSDLYRNRKDEL